MKIHGFCTVGFTAALPGWTAYYFSGDPEKPITYPVIGWLLQKQIAYDDSTWKDLPPEHEYQRVQAGIVSDCDMGEVTAVDPMDLQFWGLWGPHHTPPTKEECRDAHAKFLEEKEKKRRAS